MDTNNDQSFLTRLKQPPHLRERVETLLNIVDNVAGDCTKADVAEQSIIAEVRKRGTAALQGWAEQAGQKAPAAERHKRPALQGNGKKSLVAYDVRAHRGHRVGLAGRGPPGAPRSPVG